MSGIVTEHPAARRQRARRAALRAQRSAWSAPGQESWLDDGDHDDWDDEAWADDERAPRGATSRSRWRRRSRSGSGYGGGARMLRMGDSRRRGIALIFVTIAILIVFCGRLIDLQAVRASSLADAALGQRLRSVTIPASRGVIMDRHGVPLAISVDARNVTADQTLIDDPAAVARALAPLLGADEGALTSRLTGTRRFIYVAKDISPQTWRAIDALALPGIYSEQTARRSYPAGTIAANVVGFVGADGKGMGGLEFGLNDVLSGTPGEQTYERGPGGRVIPTAAQSSLPAIAGSSVRITVDSDIQVEAQRILAEAVAKSRSDSGTVVVMDPRTGDILALAAMPSFDSANPGTARAQDRGNRALSDVYEPGSTSKVMTAAAVIEEGKLSPTSAMTIPSTLTRGDGKVFHDSEAHGTIGLTFTGVMARSSNLGMILAAERIGGRKLWKYLRAFGIGSPTGLNFPGESTGKLPDYDRWTATTFPTLAFGQGLSVNAVQAADVFATIANDGVRLQPRLVDAIIDARGIQTPNPIAAGTRVVSASTARQVREMLEVVVSDRGTAPKAQIPGYRVAGKTGTAQYVDPTCGCYNGGVVASFIGMAPADKPRLVVAVSLVNPRIGRYGGQLAAPVFRKVMRYALQARHVPPTGGQAPNLPISAG